LNPGTVRHFHSRLSAGMEETDVLINELNATLFLLQGSNFLFPQCHISSVVIVWLLMK
jgi:hypothetical protein